MAVTKKTGLVTPDCYARALADCDGGPTTREHYISESILERIGPSLGIIGTPWAREERRVGAAALTARVLCRRHNEMLSPLDSEALRFFEVLDDVGQRNVLGKRAFDGRLIERWALKVLVGLVASSNALRADGVRVGDPIDEYLVAAVRGNLLLWLFGLQPLPEDLGFHIMVARPGTRAALLNVGINSVPIGQPEERMIRGITFQMHGLYFTISFLLLRGEGVWHRPSVVRLMHYAALTFNWGYPSDLVVELGDSRALFDGESPPP